MNPEPAQHAETVRPRPTMGIVYVVLFDCEGDGEKRQIGSIHDSKESALAFQRPGEYVQAYALWTLQSDGTPDA